MFGIKKQVKTDKLEAKAEAIGAVLNAHKVFGDVEGKWLESEVRAFRSMSVAQAKTEGYSRYLELTYPYNCVRLIINTAVVNGEAFFTDITAYDHPWKSETMDYEALNADIQAELAK